MLAIGYDHSREIIPQSTANLLSNVSSYLRKCFPVFRKTLVFLICVVLIICSFPAALASGITPLVILLYMTGSNLESEGGSASADIEEIMTYLPQDQSIRVIAMISGSSQWKLNIPREETSIYEISSGGLTKVQQLESRSMGDPGTLSSFLSFAKEQFPAERYGLILWNHGAGPLIGVCFDETYKMGNEMDHLTMEELQQALSSSPFANDKLTFFGFDACLMATLEVAFIITPFADYMITSQETEPSTGWNYAFLQDLNGYESGNTIGEKIVNAYESSLNNSSRAATLSCLDLSRTESVLGALNRLFTDIEVNVTPASYPDYAQIRSDSKVFGTSTTSDYDLVDLVDLLNMYQDNSLADCSEAINLIRDMVVRQFVARKDEYVHGISIYYPFDNKSMYESSWASLYHHMSFVPEYQSYIQRITDIYLGDQLLNWKSGYHLEIMENTGSIRLSAGLTPEEIRNAVRTRLIVVEEIQQGAYQHIFYSDGKQVHKADSEISARYHGEALYLISPEGEILAGPVSWYPIDGGISIYGIAEYAIDWDNFDWTQPMESLMIQDPIRLIYQSDESGRLSFTDMVILSDSQNGMNLPSSIGWDAISDLKIINTGISDITSLEHVVLDDSFTFLVPVSEEAPRFAFLPVFGNNNRYAYLRITDTQGNTICSEAVRIDNPTRIPLAQDQHCTEQNQIQISLKSADLITGYQSGIKCIFSIRNNSESVNQVSVHHALLENTPLHPVIWHRNTINPGEEDEFVVFIDRNAIRDTGIREADILTFTFCLDDETGISETVDAKINLQVNTGIFSVAESGNTSEK